VVRSEVVNPESLGRPLGYSHGVRVGGLLFVSGQIGADPRGDGRHLVVSKELVPQFEKALQNVLEVVRAAGGGPEGIAEMVVYVKDMRTYRRSRKELGEAWKRVMGRHYPAMTLVEVSDLFEDGTLVEIRAVAAVG
jgi:enamine deaminase RidA (YjgF/YER057c/UK114 family)